MATNIEFVIVAETEQAARFTASDAVRSGDRHVWLDPRISHVAVARQDRAGRVRQAHGYRLGLPWRMMCAV